MLCAFFVIMSMQSASVHARELEIVDAREQLTQVLKEVDELQRQVSFASTEAFVEQQARDRFGYIKPGETRYQREGSSIGGDAQAQK